MSHQQIDLIAAVLGASDVVRQKWRSRGSVPHRWRLPILQEAARRGVEIDVRLFEKYRFLYRASPKNRKPRRSRLSDAAPEQVASST